MPSAVGANSAWRPKRPRVGVVAALTHRDWGLASSYRTFYVTDLLFGILNLAVFLFISRTFADVPSASLDGASSYFAFAAVGIAIAVVIQSTSVGLARQIRQEQLTGTLEALVGHPVTASELALGLAGFPVIFAMVRAVVYLGIAAPWMELDTASTDWAGTALMLVATAAALAAIGIAVCALVLVFKRSGGVAAVLSLGLGALGGALFPLSVLPSWLGVIADFNPLRAAFEGVRSAMFQGGGWEESAAVLVIFAALAAPLAIGLFALALRWTRRTGTLGQY